VYKYVYEYNEAEGLALQMIDETLKSYVEESSLRGENL